jgi:antitoxin VapB
MALNIKDPVAEGLAAEVAALAGETKTGAIRVALAERRERLLAERAAGERAARIRQVLEDEIWPLIPPELLDRQPLSKDERDEILGYGPEGV